MKNTLKISVLLLLLSVSCNGRSVKQNQHPPPMDLELQQEHVVEEEPDAAWDSIRPFSHPKDVYCEAPILVDTLIGNFHIRYKWICNDHVIVRHEIYKYADNSLFLNIDYQGRKIRSNLEFRTADFSKIFAPDEMSEYELRPPFIKMVSDSSVVFSIGFYMPDTDVGYAAELTVDCNGKHTYTEVLLDEPGENEF